MAHWRKLNGHITYIWNRRNTKSFVVNNFCYNFSRFIRETTTTSLSHVTRFSFVCCTLLMYKNIRLTLYSFNPFISYSGSIPPVCGHGGMWNLCRFWFFRTSWLFQLGKRKISLLYLNSSRHTFIYFLLKNHDWIIYFTTQQIIKGGWRFLTTLYNK